MMKSAPSIPQASNVSNEKLEVYARTMVVGGFAVDTMRAEVVENITTFMKGATGVEEVYAYRRGSIGFVKFDNASNIPAILTVQGGSDDNRPHFFVRRTADTVDIGVPSGRNNN